MTQCERRENMSTELKWNTMKFLMQIIQSLSEGFKYLTLKNQEEGKWSEKEGGEKGVKDYLNMVSSSSWIL